MADGTSIEWADATFNPWIGCTKISPACDHCYAERSTPARAGGIAWGTGAPRRRTSPATWKLPLRWNSKRFMECGECGWRGECDAELIGCGSCGSSNAMNDARRRVFCASLADVFDNEVPREWFVELLELIRSTPNLDWLLLTKRVGRVKAALEAALRDVNVHQSGKDLFEWIRSWTNGEAPANVWLGATICNQAEADRDIPKLLDVPAAIRWLSCEPLLGMLNLGYANFDPLRFPSYMRVWLDEIHWVIAGGESGPGARPIHPDWARSLRDQCAAAGVPFFFKQWGEFSLEYDRDRDDPDYRRCDRMNRLPGRWVNLAGGHGFHGDRVHYAHKVGKKRAGRLLDGREHNAWPRPANLKKI